MFVLLEKKFTTNLKEKYLKFRRLFDFLAVVFSSFYVSLREKK